MCGEGGGEALHAVVGLGVCAVRGQGGKATAGWPLSLVVPAGTLSDDLIGYKA